jgi:Mg2+ and Co2+ transporter CorA
MIDEKYLCHVTWTVALLARDASDARHIKKMFHLHLSYLDDNARQRQRQRRSMLSDKYRVNEKKKKRMTSWMCRINILNVSFFLRQNVHVFFLKKRRFLHIKNSLCDIKKRKLLWEREKKCISSAFTYVSCVF